MKQYIIITTTFDNKDELDKVTLRPDVFCDIID